DARRPATDPHRRPAHGRPRHPHHRHARRSAPRQDPSRRTAGGLMFTGLVEEQGTVTDVEDLGDAIRLRIEAPLVTSDATHGASIAVNGCCLTVMELTGASFAADVMAESLAKTSLGDLTVGSVVNLE